MYLSAIMSAPTLLKKGCGRTVTLISKSPDSPLVEKLPFLDILRLTPESTPLGIVMVSFACVYCVPAPLQEMHY